jgi:hypothetical protein
MRYCDFAVAEEIQVTPEAAAIVARVKLVHASPARARTALEAVLMTFRWEQLGSNHALVTISSSLRQLESTIVSDRRTQEAPFVSG